MTPAEQVAAWVEALERAVSLNERIFGLTGGEPDKAALRTLRDALMRGQVTYCPYGDAGHFIVLPLAEEVKP